MGKTFLYVNADHRPDGTIRPLHIKWDDGRIFTIDRLLDVLQASALKAGGCGILYRCMVHGKQVDLFNEEGQWYIDR